jgi:outer membrane protein, heavy metal efflux system
MVLSPNSAISARRHSDGSAPRLWPFITLRRVFRRVALGIALTSSLAVGGTAHAEPAIPGKSVESVREWLLESNPELRALGSETDAAEAAIFPAGALPDPVASIALRGINTSHPSLLPGNVGSAVYQVRQRFPLWGKRGIARDVARQRAQAMGFERSATALELLLQGEQSYVRYWHAEESVKVIDRLIALLEQVEDLARVRYGLGMAAQQDSIRAQVERTNMQRQRIERLAVRQEASAALNAVLGRSVEAPLAEPTGQPVLPVKPATLTDALRPLENGEHPLLLASRTLASAARSNVELERRNRFPDISLGVGAMQRGSGLDSYELMLEVEIPFQQHARRERERQSRLLEDAALTRADASRIDLEGRLGAAWVRWTSAREQRDLIEHTLIPQSDANFKSALASYQVGEVDFGTLLSALREWQGADLARVDATRDELLGAAEVRAIDGEY